MDTFLPLIYSNLESIIFVISASINSLLFLLILFKSPEKIGAYRYLMLTFSGYCLIFSLVTWLGEPTSVATGQVYIIFVRRENPLRYDLWKHILVCMYSTSIGILMYLIAVQFIYRYCLICKYFSCRRRLGAFDCGSGEKNDGDGECDESCIPLIFMFLPITIIIIIPLFGLSPKFLVQISAISISIYPILDPLAVLIIVSSYREFFIECIRCCRPKKMAAILKNSCMTVDEGFETEIL
ncbi:hypothetical protein CRE_21292 [Caenorhabditis remanei]|uniref:G-protein coupled receptors family 1 profile domain-containing protein n=1 Tax=Caenorhabditis remanei TaxID=31234 RepID=E3MF98_CAERE|nr:hypothetical protein CRE_21292 [Caenorhabditis remanei]